MVDLHSQALETLILNFGQRIVAKNGDKGLVIRHDGELNSLGEGGSLLASPGNGKKLEFNHSVTFLGAGEVSRTGHDRLPISIWLLLLQDKAETVQPRSVGEEPGLTTVVVKRECSWCGQERFGLGEGFRHLLRPNPIVLPLQKRMEWLCQLSDGVGEMSLLLGEAQERAQFCQGLRCWKISDGLVERWVEGCTSLVDEVPSKDDRVA